MLGGEKLKMKHIFQCFYNALCGSLLCGGTKLTVTSIGLSPPLDMI